jgi:hypothetical protein
MRRFGPTVLDLDYPLTIDWFTCHEHSSRRESLLGVSLDFARTGSRPFFLSHRILIVNRNSYRITPHIRSCQAIEYIDLYNTMSVSALTRMWPENDQLDDRIGVYRELFLSAGDAAGMQDALLKRAEYHLDPAAYIAPSNEANSSYPLRNSYTTLFAFDLLGWVGFYKRLKGAISTEITLPMQSPTLFNPPARRQYWMQILLN